MAFKMNTSIGKIYAKTQGTKPHAKAIATAKAPTPAKGNVHSVDNPLTYSSPLKVDNPTDAQKLAKGLTSMASNENKRKKQDPYKKAENKDKDLGSYVKKQKSLKKGTPEWNANQNKINKAYGVKKRYGEGNSTTSTTSTPATESTTKKVISQKDKDKEKGRQKAIMDRPRVKMGDNKSKDNKSKDKIEGSDLVGKSKSKRGDKLRNKADNAKSVAEKNRLQNRADRKDGRAERRAARVARRSGNMTKAEAKAKIKESRSKQKSTANRSTAPQSGQINNVRSVSNP